MVVFLFCLFFKFILVLLSLFLGVFCFFRILFFLFWGKVGVLLKVTTVNEVWICDPNYHKTRWTFALNFSNY